MKKLDTILALGLASCASNDRVDPNKVSVGECEVAQPVQPFSLGNLRFVFASSGFVPDEQHEIYEKLHLASEKIRSLLGDDVFFLTEPIQVVIKPLRGGGFGLTGMNTVILTPGQEPVGQTITESYLALGDLSEANIAHELVHLLTQAHLDSGLFHEGLPYGITHTLYPSFHFEHKAITNIQEVRSACTEEVIFSLGLDGPTIYELILPGSLHQMRYMHYALKWEEIMKENPLLLRAFFRDLAEYRESGKWYFSRQDLDGMMQSLWPQWSQWLEIVAPAMKPLEAQARYGLIDTGGGLFQYLNYILLPGDANTLPTLTRVDKAKSFSINGVPKGNGPFWIVDASQVSGQIRTSDFSNEDGVNLRVLCAE